jgi:hypothetical protein
VKLKSQCGRGAYVRDVLYENITGFDIDGAAVWMDMDYGGGSSKPCPENETSIFSNITVRNLYVVQAIDAYTIVGDAIKGHGQRPTIVGLTLENVTVLKYDHKGECTHANISINGKLSPKPAATDTTCTITEDDIASEYGS